MEKNPFGGRKGSLYTPMSEDEQEVLERLVQARDLDVVIKGWGYIQGIQATVGDLRVSLPLMLSFGGPEIPVPVHYFDLELRTGSGVLLFAERQSAHHFGAPIMVGAGTTLQMVWDIAIKRMDPKLVKALKPGARGLTSRWTDKDTGDLTLFGNTRLSSQERSLLKHVRKGEQAAREDNERLRKKAENAEKSS